MIDGTGYIEQCGVRKVRFGGYEPEDVRTALRTLAADCEQRVTQAEEDAQRLRQENDALQKHCEALTAQNQTLSAQNAALAGSSERYSRRGDELDGQLSSLRDRNHSLNDQIARLRLQNNDLTRDNAALQDQVEQAEATLRHKGEALDKERSELAARRERLLAEAEAEATRLVEAARREAAQTEAQARQNAEAIEHTAREQAKAQARRMVDAATEEANEIQNAHQLRLLDLQGKVSGLENRRDQLADYLSRIGQELLDTRRRMEENAPVEELPPPEQPLELQPVPTPELELDLSPEKVAQAAAALAAERAAPAAPPESAFPDATPLVEAAPTPDSPAPDGRAPAPHRGFTLVQGEDAPGSAAAAEGPAFYETPSRAAETVEVPGAIFSYPIRRPADEPILDDEPPVPGPRDPVLPVLPSEEDEAAAGEVLDALDLLSGRPGVIEPPKAPAVGGSALAVRRKKAVTALRALERMARERGF